MKAVTLILSFLLIGGAWAQKPTQSKKEALKAEKKAFVDQFVGFTTDESTKFWLLHDEMHQKMKALKKGSGQSMKAIKEKGIDNVSDAELRKAMDDRKNMEEKMHALRWEYNEKYIAAVGIKKTAKFYEAERAFKKELMKKLKSGGAPHGAGGHHDRED